MPAATSNVVQIQVAPVTHLTRLLLHFDGTEHQTTTVDSSFYDWPVTMDAACELETSWIPSYGGAGVPTGPMFGTAALMLQNTPETGQVVVPFTAGSALDIVAAGGDFTMEGFACNVSADGNQHLFYGDGGTTFLGVNWSVENTYENWTISAQSQDGTLIHATDGAPGQPAVHGWLHFALVNESGTLTLYWNGQAIGSIAFPGFTLPASPSVTITGDGNSDQMAFDEIRISSVARYSGDFTPPTAPFTPD